jgi:hypothetical protein
MISWCHRTNEKEKFQSFHVQLLNQLNLFLHNFGNKKSTVWSIKIWVGFCASSRFYRDPGEAPCGRLQKFRLCTYLSYPQTLTTQHSVSNPHQRRFTCPRASKPRPTSTNSPILPTSTQPKPKTPVWTQTVAQAGRNACTLRPSSPKQVSHVKLPSGVW